MGLSPGGEAGLLGHRWPLVASVVHVGLGPPSLEITKELGKIRKTLKIDEKSLFSAHNSRHQSFFLVIAQNTLLN